MKNQYMRYLAIAIVLGVFANPVYGARKGLRVKDRPDFKPLAPLSRIGAQAEIKAEIRAGQADFSGTQGTRVQGRILSLPVDSAANFFVTRDSRFRILWGDEYDSYDPQWDDPDHDGYPTWVETLADALTSAYAKQAELGFSMPYGMDQYMLDVYVGNTGLRIYNTDFNRWDTVWLSEDYYSLTEIDTEYKAAYFIFNDDYYSLANGKDELAVLRVVAAHELFHAVQRSYVPWDDEQQIADDRWDAERWFFEATATWMEETCQPDVNDYVQYVKVFLSAPEKPLNYSDGFRDYGAASFAGYLWLYRGGAPLWLDIFQNMFALGVEGAIAQGLEKFGYPGLADVLAEFWTLAAHPEDTWPDGHLYKTDNSPFILETIIEADHEIAPLSPYGPARLGANLYHVQNSKSNLSITFANTNGAAWQVGFSEPGSSDAETVYMDIGKKASKKNIGGQTYVAIVNVSEEDGAALYEGRIIQTDTPADDSGGNNDDGDSGGGGCFISILP